jgi:PAS domain-containing protein
MPNKAATLPKNGDGSSRVAAGKRLAKLQHSANRAAGAESFPEHLDFQLLFSSHPEAMVVLDVNHRIRMCNPAF